MKEHEARALELARWLEGLEGVVSVLHPGLASHPDHALFKRDFSGSGSLFGFVLVPAPRPALAAMLDKLKLFGMGYSWGGFESLILPSRVEEARTATRFEPGGNLFRVHVGFEDMGDIVADLDAAIGRYRAAL
jgi:cystathionine beta-lyase